MRGKRKNLPPLDFLIAFEASAHLSNFTAAAEQLNLTQSAISRQIRLLEENLGQKLFVRDHRSVTLTAKGRAFLPIVTNALDHIENASRELRLTSENMTVTISATQSIASLWLMPQVKRFQQENPDVEIKLISSDNDEYCLGEAVDIAILLGDGAWSGYKSTLLFKEEIFPVCSPSYLAGSAPLSVPYDLVDHALIDIVENHDEWVNWRFWLTENRIKPLKSIKRLSFNTYPLAIQAACDGLGVALGWRHLVDDKLRDGTLIAPLDVAISTDQGYYIMTKTGRQLNAAAQNLVDCLEAAA